MYATEIKPIKANWILYIRLFIMLFNWSTMTNSDVTGGMFSNFFAMWLDLFQVLFPYTVFWYSVSSKLQHWRWIFILVAFRLRFCYQNITLVAVCDINSDSISGTILLHYVNKGFIVVLQPNENYGLLIHEVFLDHTQWCTTVGRTPSGQVISSLQRPLPDNTEHTTDKHPCPRWDSNSRSQLASGRRPTP